MSESLEQGSKDDIWKSFVFAVSIEWGMGLAAFFVGWLAGIAPVKHFSWTWIAARGGLLTPWIPLVIFSVLFCLKIPAVRQHLSQMREVELEMSPGWSWYHYFLSSICVGIGECLFFQGLIQEGLMRLWGPWPAMIITGLAFGMLHWLNNFYFLWGTFIGMFLCALYWLSGNLLGPVIFHIIYDFGLTVLQRYWFYRFLPENGFQKDGQ
ncbi:MAG: CPBP family intramembrane metalloprotease [Verrucomicrobia bacterium]|nr:CPBP family intramembrane metalloprotease [Verrucomicrobiota bacterium]